MNGQGVAALLPLNDPEALAAQLARLEGVSPFAVLEDVHFLRFQLTELADENERLLLFGAEFDGTVEELLDGVCRVPAADAIFACCDGYPGTDAPVAFRHWVLDHRVRAGFSVLGNPGASVREIRESLALREQIVAFALETRGLDPEAFAACWRDTWG